ncbi:acetate kinase [Eubacterium nodatum ATCC 33099]|nr:acetate kinase [Eubacterium nodatum ATCC 33099]
MLVLVINCGSSSLKYQLLEMTTETLMAKGLVERIGIEGSVIKHETIGKEKYVSTTPMKDHTDAISHVMNAITHPEHGAIKELSEIKAVGHRVVHAGEKYANSVIINDDVIAVLEECAELAPLHNPPNLAGVRACEKLMPGVPNVGVFDTAFHQTMRPEAYLYAIPYEMYEKHRIRKYGFHGTSHKYMAIEASEMLNIDVNDLKLITCHLGNGASVSAIKHGRSVETSMGFTPLEGLVMGTRCGDLDPSIVTLMAEKLGIGLDQVTEILNKESGVLGISGVSSDFRDLEEAMKEGNKRAELALKIFAHRVRFYIGAYIAEMNGVDAIVFTGGIGENDAYMRDVICANMGNLGIKLDKEKNKVRGKQTMLSADDSKVKVMLIPANEELVIARETDELVKKA